MKITINGTPTELAAETLDAALGELGHDPTRVATAVNERFVPAGARAQTRLAPGDRVEILAPRQGG